MKFLFFSFIAAVVSVSLDHKPQKINTANLLAVEGGKEKILELIEQLRATNKNDLQSAKDAFAAATTTRTNSQKTYDAAKSAEFDALGNVVNKKNEIEGLEKIVVEKRVVEQRLLGEANAAVSVFESALAQLNSEKKRVAEEEKILNDVLDLLNKLAESAEGLLETSDAARNLLSIVDLSSLADADPAAIGQVREMINELIAAGNADLARAQKSHDDAQEKMNDALNKYKVAWDALALAMGNVRFAQKELAVLEGIAEKATSARIAAYNQLQDDIAAYNDAEKHLNDETKRVADEEEVFVKVTKLLSNLQ